MIRSYSASAVLADDGLVDVIVPGCGGPAVLRYRFGVHVVRALWARRAVESRHHKRFAVPVVFYLIGWVTVWPKFLTEQQFVWPAVVVFIWQFVFWCETAAGVAGGLVLAGKDDAVSAKK